MNTKLIKTLIQKNKGYEKFRRKLLETNRRTRMV